MQETFTMKTPKSLLLLVGALVLAGCSDPAPIETAPVKRAVEAKRADTLNDQVDKALLLGSHEDLQADRMMLRQWRRGGETNPQAWPSCDRVAGLYSDTASLKTLVGVQDSLSAAQVDDYVLCDKPTIFSAAKQGAEKAIARLAPELVGKDVSTILADNPRSSKMDDCWLQALRDSRQTNAPYSEAMQRADARCTVK